MSGVCAILESESPLKLEQIESQNTQQQHLYPLQAGPLVPMHHLS